MFVFFFFFFNDTAPTEIYTLSLHDALPISPCSAAAATASATMLGMSCHLRSRNTRSPRATNSRSEEHTSELQSRFDLVCRLLLEKKKHTAPHPTSDRSHHATPSLAASRRPS